jgi:hypothetical protein
MSLYKITVILASRKLGCIHAFPSTFDAIAAMGKLFPAAQSVAVINLGRV